MDAEILTADEAAAMLRVSTDVVLNLMLTSEIPARSIGGKWLTTRRALISFVDGAPLQTNCCSPEMCCGQGEAGRGCC